jgi:hypothetical protein
VGEPESRPADRSPELVRADDESTRRALLAEVYRSKDRVAQIEREMPLGKGRRDRGPTAQVLLEARRNALQALENYSAALRLRGWPTPTKMVREIHLLRSLCGQASAGVPRETRRG